MNALSTEILIVGAGVGGVSAALSIARLGGTCILTEQSLMIGGQFTSQAVPPDENRWVEGEGSSRSYADFRKAIRAWCRSNYALTASALQHPNLNPGGGWVSHLCFEPRAAMDVLGQMLAPYVASGRVKVFTGLTPTGVDAEGDRVRAVRLSRPDGSTVTVSAKYFLDATETGDLYPLARVEHMTGSECREQFNELHALPRAQIAGSIARPEGAIEEPGRLAAGGDPYDQQACSWCFAIEHHPEQDNTIARPAMYDFWRSYVPPMRDVPWTGPLLSWTVPSHNAEGRRTFPFIPCPDQCDSKLWEMWRYRRIVDAGIHDPRDPRSRNITDVCLVNWVQMDYWLRPLLGVDARAVALAEDEARQLSLSLLYWMQTEAPRWDSAGQLTGKVGYPGLRLAGAPLGTGDGLALRPYIREPRRLLARKVITEGHIGVEQRELDLQHSTLPAERRPKLFTVLAGAKQALAEPFEDSVGIGHYTLDLHPSTALRNSVYVPAAPFRIPLGSLVPVRVRNLVAGGKGIGVTHIANGCTRMHQVEWSIGEAAGALAAHCCQRALEPHQVSASLELTHEFQALLRDQGVPMRWSWE